MAERRPGSAAGGHLVVAIDGPSGSGKSTVARAVARALGVAYLDTGAMYRAITWAVLDRGGPLDDEEAISDVARSVDLRLGNSPDDTTVQVDGVDVSRAIRGPEVTAAVSRVSAIPGVRAALVQRQREVIDAGPVVVEGRDIGTVVAPHARVKVFLTADPAERAKRRGLEIAGDHLDEAQRAATEASLRTRDAADSTRAASPLAQAPDALVIDSTHDDVEAVVRRILTEVEAMSAR